MPQYYDSKGNTHKLAEEIGRGGEGTVFFCEGNDELVAKIYHESISDEKAKKLQLMATNKNERLLKVAAWVVETLHDKPNGKVVGFLMPRIKAKEIHELYSLKSRRRHFPQATWHYLIHTSTNLARAFYSLHKYKHVIGDVNHGNCVVLADGTVKLIDCDSYAISDGEKRFRCEVGVATHLAPELQKANLSEIERKPEHDNFALAVVIFQLLFLGRHPFAGNYLGEKDKTLEDCIREFRFAYGKNAKKSNVRQPPGTLFLDEVSPRVTELFERAFDEKSDNRPTPREWIEALVNMSENLQQCGINPGHRYYNGVVSCPWCRIESQTGLMLFPFVFNEENVNEKAPFNIFTVEKLIENLGKNRNLPAKLVQPNSLANIEPAREIIESGKLNRNHQFLFVGGYFLGLVFLTMLFGIFLGTVFGIFLMIYLFATLSNDNKELQTSLMSELTAAERKLLKLEKEFALQSSPKMFAGDIQEIRNKVKDYKDLQLNTRSELKRIETEHNHRKYQDYLRQFRVADNEIEGISKTSKDKLVKKRVWTAAEIDKDRLLNVYDVGSWTASKLLKWREKLEKGFVGDKKSEVLKEKKEKYLLQLKTKTRKIEKDIEKSLEELRKNSIEVEKSQKMLIPKSEKLAKVVAQSRSNLNAVGDTSVALASLILITVLVPLFGGIISEFSSSRSNNVTIVTDEKADWKDGGDGELVAVQDSQQENNSDDKSFKYGGEVLSEDEAKALPVPDAEITDEAILELDDKTRKELSDNLVRQSIHFVKNFGQISNKEKEKRINELREKVRLAIRVKRDNISAYEEFGITLYNYKYYKQSLEYFLDIEKLVEKTNVTQIYSGTSYLMLKDYNKAKDIFVRLKQYDSSSNISFNLGLAYKGLKNYKLAAEAFETASDLSPYDSDAQFELGFTYFKLNQKEKFNKQYAKLLELSPDRAKQLLDISYKLPPSAKELEEAAGESEKVITTIEEPKKVVRTNIPDSPAVE